MTGIISTAWREGGFGRFLLIAFSAAVCLFLIVPIVVVIPLSFSSSSFFVYPPPQYSLRWYRELFSNPEWLNAIKNSLIIAICSTALATVLGTMAALGLNYNKFPGRAFLRGLLISPMIVPTVITGVGLYFLMDRVGLLNSLTGLVLADAVLGVPFVVVTVLATLTTYDSRLSMAASCLGATPFYAFRRVTMPVIMPGIVTGAIFAFITSFDEVVVVQFLGGPNQRTLPRQMFSGIREFINPTILAAASLFIGVSIVGLSLILWLQQKQTKARAPAKGR